MPPRSLYAGVATNLGNRPAAITVNPIEEKSNPADCGKHDTSKRVCEKVDLNEKANAVTVNEAGKGSSIKTKTIQIDQRPNPPRFG